MTVDTIIRGGTLVEATGRQRASLAFDDGKIVAVGQLDSLPPAEEIVDATGCLVMPGMVDPHVHVHDEGEMPIKEDYTQASAAAATGGVTTFVDFAWQDRIGYESDDEESLLAGIERKRQKGKRAMVDFSVHGAVTREDPTVLEAIPEAVERGVTSFKVFTVYDQGISHGFIDEVAQAVGAADGVLAAHTEDGSVCDRRTNELIEAGRGAMSDQPASRPPRSESMEAAAVGRLACEAGCRYYGVHTTARGAVRALEALQKEFGPEQVRAETCIQYATLDESALADLGELGITTPPLRPSDHREAVFDAVVNGGLDIVSTDHVGITAAEKAGEQWWDVQSGITGLSTSFPVFYDEAVVRRGYDPSLVVDVMSATPARLFGMPEKGSLAIGTDADVVVVDPDAETVVRGEDEAGRADYSVYEGRKLGLGVEQTFVRGTLVAESGTVVGEPGHGQFVERSVPDWTPNRGTGVDDV